MTDSIPLLAIVVAMTDNRVIGLQNQIPWHLSEDLKRVRALTMGKPIIMGRNTFESIGKPLPGRINIVVTSHPEQLAPGCITASSINAAISQAKMYDPKEIIIFGGSRIYQEVLPQVDKMYVTQIHHDFDGDAFFPEWSMDDWDILKKETRHSESKPEFSYTFLTLVRKGK